MPVTYAASALQSVMCFLINHVKDVVFLLGLSLMVLILLSISCAHLSEFMRWSNIYCTVENPVVWINSGLFLPERVSSCMCKPCPSRYTYFRIRVIFFPFVVWFVKPVHTLHFPDPWTDWRCSWNLYWNICPVLDIASHDLISISALGQWDLLGWHFFRFLTR